MGHQENTASTSFDPKGVSISIVSHGHGAFLADLLKDLQPYMAAGVQVILTLNIPEDESFLNGLQLWPELIRNEASQGFGSNHNAAFLKVQRPWFVVLNPDVRIQSKVFENLIMANWDEATAVVAPRITNRFGEPEDNARKYPTVLRVLRRSGLRLLRKPLPLEYVCISSFGVQEVDWVSGCFMAFKARSFKLVGGFDTKYHMYLEDTDICRRLHSAGMKVLVVCQATAIHLSQRASHYRLRYFLWHLKSLFTYWLTSPKEIIKL